ncbi:unnamed protein product [Prorocentrum cordatum]|uniref:Uncharacterized protein n=1 Tax=Prorocentrum cordatum TaxID=2364126 RepID=A0ABN9RQ33_9DINO|nr:unnamed protein product [Polarella glacialis]
MDVLRRNIGLHADAVGVDVATADAQELRRAQRGPRLEARQSPGPHDAGLVGSASEDDAPVPAAVVRSTLRAEAAEFAPAVVEKMTLRAEAAQFFPAERTAIPTAGGARWRCTCGAVVFSGIPAAALPPFVRPSRDGWRHRGPRGLRAPGLLTGDVFCEVLADAIADRVEGTLPGDGRCNGGGLTADSTKQPKPECSDIDSLHAQELEAKLATWRRQAPSAQIFVLRRLKLRAVEAAWRQHAQEVEAQAATWRREWSSRPFVRRLAELDRACACEPRRADEQLYCKSEQHGSSSQRLPFRFAPNSFRPPDFQTDGDPRREDRRKR